MNEEKSLSEIALSNNLKSTLNILDKILVEKESENMIEEYEKWWNELSIEWKKIFIAHLYYPDEIRVIQESSEILQKKIIDMEFDKILPTTYFSRDNSEIISEYGSFRPMKDLAELFTLSSIKYKCSSEDRERYYPRLCIKNIPNLNYFRNLYVIDLSFNLISDVNNLNNLNYLACLNVSVNDIEDIFPLSKLTSLFYLDISYNEKIYDVRCLSSLRNLKKLIIRGNKRISKRDIDYLKEKLPSCEILS